jgi:hypothetical protein
MFPCCIVLIGLVLTKLLVVGNTHINGKKQPVPLIRNTFPKDTNGEKQSSPPMRPSSAIDPLSHVCLPTPSVVRVTVYGIFAAEP